MTSSGPQVLWDGYLQKLLSEWCRVHKDLVEDEVHQVGNVACAILKKAKQIFGLDLCMHVKTLSVLFDFCHCCCNATVFFERDLKCEISNVRCTFCCVNSCIINI